MYELVANVIEHGNKFDPDKKVVIKLKITNHYIVAGVFDEGEGFDWQKIYDNLTDIDHSGERGRGIIMTKMLCKNLLYNEKGNEAYLVMENNI